jgi:transcription termination factor NusB
MNDATSEMLNSTFSQMKQFLTALDSRIEVLEQRFVNDARITKIEERLDAISTESDERISAIVESKLEDYDPTEHRNFEGEVERIVENQESIEDQIREYISSNVSVEISCN